MVDFQYAFPYYLKLQIYKGIMDFGNTARAQMQIKFRQPPAGLRPPRVKQTSMAAHLLLFGDGSGWRGIP
jgi:hypothetical protein